jgi:hypothetical protein
VSSLAGAVPVGRELPAGCVQDTSSPFMCVVLKQNHKVGDYKKVRSGPSPILQMRNPSPTKTAYCPFPASSLIISFIYWVPDIYLALS